jgi:hypothetical protein
VTISIFYESNWVSRHSYNARSKSIPLEGCSSDSQTSATREPLVKESPLSDSVGFRVRRRRYRRSSNSGFEARTTRLEPVRNVVAVSYFEAPVSASASSRRAYSTTALELTSCQQSCEEREREETNSLGRRGQAFRHDPLCWCDLLRTNCSLTEQDARFMQKGLDRHFGVGFNLSTLHPFFFQLHFNSVCQLRINSLP